MQFTLYDMYFLALYPNVFDKNSTLYNYSYEEIVNLVEDLLQHREDVIAEGLTRLLGVQ